MNIYLVRHGETVGNKEEIFRGRKDVPLNDTGKKQAQATAAYFARVSVKPILSSPLSRALRTAAPIGETVGIPVETMEALTDIDFGAWEGLSLREVEARYPNDLALWRESPEKLRVENGESLAVARERIAAGLANIVTGEEGAIIVVTHRVICKLIVLHFLGIGDEHFWDMKFDPGSISLLEGQHGRFTLVFSNNTYHLKETYSGKYGDF
jgi:phosphoserine phosphatase